MKRHFTRIQIASLLEIEEGFVIELERHELIVADRDERFDARSLERVRVCWTMHDHLGVNIAGLEVAIHLLERWQDERRRVHALIEELKSERED